MSETRALSPEIKGLFDTVKKQSKNYEAAFNIFAENNKIFSKMIEDANELMEELKAQPERMSNKVNSDIKQSINQLSIEKDNLVSQYEFVNQIAQIIDEQKERLNQIQNFKKELEKLQDSLLNNKRQVEVLFNETKVQTENTIKKIIQDGKEQIQDEIESNARQVENNIILRQRQIEGKLIAFDEKYFNITDQFKSDFKRLNSEMQMFENQIEEIRMKSKAVKTVDPEEIEKIKQDFKYKIKEIENKINTINNTYRPQSTQTAQVTNPDNYYESEDAKSNDPNIEKAIKPLRDKIHDIDERLHETEKKIGLSITMAWISILSVIVLIIVAIVFLT